MLMVDQDGWVRDARVKVRQIPQIAHGPLLHIDAIVIHQTDSATAKGTMDAYRTGATLGDGTHFLIDKDGTIYQTVSLKKKCQHVGKIKVQVLPSPFLHPTRGEILFFPERTWTVRHYS